MWAIIFLLFIVVYGGRFFLSPFIKMGELKRIRRELERQRRGF